LVGLYDFRYVVIINKTNSAVEAYADLEAI